jgi:hypothetical protein
MYNWKPRTKKSQKLWDKRVKESQDNLDWGKQMWEVYGGSELENEDFIDSRKIVYMSGMYVTKDGIILDEDDAETLDF